MAAEGMKRGPTAAEVEEDRWYRVCGSCGRDRKLDRPADVPGAIWLEHAKFTDVAGMPIQQRSTCSGSLAPLTPVAPSFAAADIGGGT